MWTQVHCLPHWPQFMVKHIKVREVCQVLWFQTGKGFIISGDFPYLKFFFNFVCKVWTKARSSGSYASEWYPMGRWGRCASIRLADYVTSSENKKWCHDGGEWYSFIQWFWQILEHCCDAMLAWAWKFPLERYHVPVIQLPQLSLKIARRSSWLSYKDHTIWCPQLGFLVLAWKFLEMCLGKAEWKGQTSEGKWSHTAYLPKLISVD